MIHRSGILRLTDSSFQFEALRIDTINLTF